MFFNPLLVFIALFVYLGASQEAALAQVKDLSRGLLVAEAMVTRFAKLPGRATVDEAAEAVVRTLQHDFPILDDQGDVRGILTRDGIIKALKRGEGTAPVQDIMHRDVPTVRSDDAFEHAFRLMEEHSSPALPVVDGDGRPVGLITPENVGETMMLCSSRADARLAERRGEHREITHRREAMPPAEPTREQEAP